MNQLRHIPTIWFSGLHRSGKWTEIDLLLNFFIENWYNPFVRKWHGTREWIGKEERDPNSERWQINSPKLKNRTTPNFDKLRMEAAERLQTELCTSYNALQIAPVAKPVILLDRTLISRYLTEKQFDDKFNFDRTLHFNPTRDSEIIGIQKTIIPDLIFVFECNLDTLKNRFTPEELMTEKGKFRRNNIERTFDLFQSIIHNIPKPIENRVRIIDGNRNRYEVHDEVIEIIKRDLPTYFEK